MPDPTPTLETVLTAIKTQMDAIVPGVGNVFKQEHRLESEFQYTLEHRDADGTAHNWFIDAVVIDQPEGDGVGEVYDVYHVSIRYLSIVKSGGTEWSEVARGRVEQVRTKLSQNPAVFQLGSGTNRQLRTAEAVELLDFGKRTIDNQQYWQAILGLSVEARRWT